MATINGFDGVDDNISGFGVPASDTLFSSTFGGNDTVLMNSSQYLIYLGEGDDVVQGGQGGSAYGEGGSDGMTAILYGNTHNHFGGDGNDRLKSFVYDSDPVYNGYGGRGLDFFTTLGAEAAARNFYGGRDFDVVRHDIFVPVGGIGLNMTLGGSGGLNGATTNTYRGIEAAIGTNGADTINGDNFNNLLIGAGGSDQVFGNGGNDFLIGENRNDSFVRAYMGLNSNFSPADAFDALNANVGGSYAEDSGALNDSLYGGTGNDVLSGGDGADVLDGGDGIDWATYLSSNEGNGATLNLLTGGTGGQALGDSYISIENVQGSNNNDVITGNRFANELRGMGSQDSLRGVDGNDTLVGGTGRDTLAGGRDTDVLTGGDAEDAFVFERGVLLLSVDTITDMTVNFDEIWLSSAIFGKLGTVGGALVAERFVTGAAAGEANDRIIYDSATGALSYDVDGTGIRLAVQFAQLSAGLSLTADDFVMIL